MFFMEIFMKKKRESEQDICKKFLKNAIVNETTAGTKKFRTDLYKKLIDFGIWNNFDFCNKIDMYEFTSYAKYKKLSDIKLVFEIWNEVREKHFSHMTIVRASVGDYTMLSEA